MVKDFQVGDKLYCQIVSKFGNNSEPTWVEYQVTKVGKSYVYVSSDSGPVYREIQCVPNADYLVEKCEFNRRHFLTQNRIIITTKLKDLKTTIKKIYLTSAESYQDTPSIEKYLAEIKVEIASLVDRL